MNLHANRLVSATVGGVTSTYAYDGDGKRASKTVAGVTTGYVYDANRDLPVVLDDGARKYVWGLDLAYAVDQSGDVLVYHTDGLGSVRAITDGTGGVVQSYQTDEFGVPTQSHGSVSQPFGYTGEQYDAETGLVYLRARYYDPTSGRFISRDLFGGMKALPASLNGYSYVHNDPVGSVDPSGRASSRVLAVGGVAIAGEAFGGLTIAGCLAYAPCAVAVGIAVVGTAAYIYVAAIQQVDDSTHPIVVPWPAYPPLPNIGSRPYIPTKKAHDGVEKNKQGKYVDRKGNEWEWDPKGRPHWDVQHPDGKHTNVTPGGEVDHGPDNFPSAP